MEGPAWRDVALGKPGPRGSAIEGLIAREACMHASPGEPGRQTHLCSPIRPQGGKQRLMSTCHVPNAGCQLSSPHSTPISSIAFAPRARSERLAEVTTAAWMLGTT